MSGALEVAGLGGRLMLAVAAVIVIVGMLLLLPRALRVRRRLLALRMAVDASQAEIFAALRRIEAQRDEIEQGLVPWRRAWRWARHPLVVALFHWYRRRRSLRSDIT